MKMSPKNNEKTPFVNVFSAKATVTYRVEVNRLIQLLFFVCQFGYRVIDPRYQDMTSTVHQGVQECNKVNHSFMTTYRKMNMS